MNFKTRKEKLNEEVVLEQKRKSEGFEPLKMPTNLIKLKIDMPLSSISKLDEMEAFCFDVSADTEKKHHSQYKPIVETQNSPTESQQQMIKKSNTLSIKAIPTTADVNGSVQNWEGMTNNLNSTPSNLDQIISNRIAISSDSTELQKYNERMEAEETLQGKDLDGDSNGKIPKVKELKIAYERESVSNNSSFNRQNPVKFPSKNSFWFFSPEFENIITSKHHGKSYREFQEAIESDNDQINNMIQEVVFEEKINDKKFDIRRFQDRSLLFMISCLKCKYSFWRRFHDHPEEDLQF